jgi:hypothetical protein
MTYSRFALAVVLTLLVLPIAAESQKSFDPGVKIGKMAPAFRLPDQDHELQDFDSLKGDGGLAPVLQDGSGAAGTRAVRILEPEIESRWDQLRQH